MTGMDYFVFFSGMAQPQPPPLGIYKNTIVVMICKPLKDLKQ